MYLSDLLLPVDLFWSAWSLGKERACRLSIGYLVDWCAHEEIVMRGGLGPSIIRFQASVISLWRLRHYNIAVYTFINTLPCLTVVSRVVATWGSCATLACIFSRPSWASIGRYNSIRGSMVGLSKAWGFGIKGTHNRSWKATLRCRVVASLSLMSRCVVRSVIAVQEEPSQGRHFFIELWSRRFRL